MKKISFFLGSFICLMTLGCSKQETVQLESLKDGYFDIAQKTEVKPLKGTELTEMLSNYDHKEMVDGNQKIYTFTTDNEELMVSEPKDHEGITDILYTKSQSPDSLAIAHSLSSNGASSLVLNTVDMDKFKTITSKLSEESSNLYNAYLNLSEKMAEDHSLTLTEVQKSINLELTLQEIASDDNYYSFKEADSGDLLGTYVTANSETVHQIVYQNNVMGLLHDTMMADNCIMFSVSTNETTLSNQKEVMSLFDK